MRRLAALTIFAVFLGCLSPPEATAQEEDDDGFDVPAGFAGELELTNEFYENTGIDARRPPALTRLRVRPTLTLFGRFDVGLNLLVSTEGSDFRQNMDEVGINPSWGWGELHAGDFANPYSEYTMGEVRIRGGGLDLTPGPLRFSIQGGRLQRSVASGAEGSTFQRNAVAGRLGFGSEEGTYLDLHALKAEDDLESVERSLLIRDTTLADTIPDGLRPQVGTRPQENLVAGLEGQLVLFDRTLRLRGEAAVALITRDKLSSEAELEGTGVASLLGGVHDFRLSTSGDFAYQVEADVRRPGWGFRGGYEFIGPGYVSLGLPYLINDRESYHVGGNVRLFENTLSLQGRFRHQNNNLLDQKEVTTDRDIVGGSASLRISRSVTTNLSVNASLISNDAASDTFAVDNTSISVSSSTAVMTELFGKTSAVSVAYTVSRSSSGNPIRPTPTVNVHNATGSLQLTLSPRFTVGPSVSGVVTSIEGQDTRNNVFVGARGRGRFLDGDLTTSLNVTRTQSSRRDMFRVLGRASYELPLGVRLGLQLRHTRYSSFGTMPSFEESFVTTSLRRSF